MAESFCTIYSDGATVLGKPTRHVAGTRIKPACSDGE